MHDSRRLRSLLTLACIALPTLALPTSAQETTGGPPAAESAKTEPSIREPGTMSARGAMSVWWLEMPLFQKELKLTEPQRAQVGQVVQAFRRKRDQLFQPTKTLRGSELIEAVEALRDEEQELVLESNWRINKILEPAQATRLDQLYVQSLGEHFLMYPLVLERLQITADQQSQMAAVRQLRHEKLTAVYRQAEQTQRPREETEREAQEIARAASESVLALLTESQRAELQAIRGEPFQFPHPRVFFQELSAGKVDPAR